jgi:hypothetical protein
MFVRDVRSYSKWMMDNLSDDREVPPPVVGAGEMEHLMYELRSFDRVVVAVYGFGLSVLNSTLR